LRHRVPLTTMLQVLVTACTVTFLAAALILRHA
jgi:hypothetical protein